MLVAAVQVVRYSHVQELMLLGTVLAEWQPCMQRPSILAVSLKLCCTNLSSFTISICIRLGKVSLPADTFQIKSQELALGRIEKLLVTVRPLIDVGLKVQAGPMII